MVVEASVDHLIKFLALFPPGSALAFVSVDPRQFPVAVARYIVFIVFLLEFKGKLLLIAVCRYTTVCRNLLVDLCIVKIHLLLGRIVFVVFFVDSDLNPLFDPVSFLLPIILIIVFNHAASPAGLRCQKSLLGLCQRGKTYLSCLPCSRRPK